MKRNLHPLLKRQIDKTLGKLPQEETWLNFIQHVNSTYKQFEEDKYLIENALELSSKELQEANASLMAIFRSFPDIIFRIDKQGTILDVKGSPSAHFLLPPTTLLNKKIQDIPDKQVSMAFEKALKELNSWEKTSFEYKLKQAGKNKYFEARLIKLNKREIIVIIRDISAQKQAEEQLLQAQKIQTINNLASGIAHDFNNILTAIKTNLEIALQKIVNPDNLKYLERSLKVINRAALLTKQLLNFTRQEQLEKKEKVNLNQICTNITSMVETLLGENITLKTDLQPGIWPISASPNQLEQVLMNLIVNAKDALPKGGEITLITRNITLSSENQREQTEYVLLMVKDNGVGISKENKDKIFEPFFTTKKRDQGTGLGLAMVAKIVHEHQGFIEVESELNKGTTFKLYFQALEEKISTKELKNQDIPNNSQLELATKPILLIEDEDFIREATAEALREKDIPVYTASSVLEAKKIFQEKYSQLALIITDIVLKDGNALEFISWALRKKRIKTVFTSGYPEKADLIKELNPKEFIYLQKPFSLRKLFTAIDSLFNS